MGKLHTLRRAIEREPEKWFRQDYDGRCFARGASRSKWFGSKQWEPTESWQVGYRSYRSFVRHILNELGYTTV